MSYSKAVFKVVAELFEAAAVDENSGVLRTFNDFAIALALDSGLPLDEVSKHLVNEINSKEGLITAFGCVDAPSWKHFEA